MRFLSKEELKKMREEFPSGCRIVLDEMDDVQAPKPGSQGTCRGVDDAGNVMVSWDTGGSLSVAYGADTCHRVASESEIKESLDWLGKTRHRGAHCPRCGACEEAGNRLLAQSRRADITVCETCGTAEALEDAGLMERMELSDWWIVKQNWRG
ncbi:MAG: DUF4314 domain-containing protein [Lachnospiraceae bacterium]